jgi:hypothetical protein
MRFPLATITVAASLFVFSGAGTAYASSNLIANGDFSSGLSDWSTFTTPNGSLGPSPLPAVVLFNGSNAAEFQVGEVSYTGLYEGGGISQSFNVAAGGTYNISVNVGAFNVGGTNASAGDFSLLLNGSLVGSSYNPGFIYTGQTLTSSLSSSDALTAGTNTLSIEITRPYVNNCCTPYQYLSNVNVSAPAVPEPSTYAMLLAGLGLIGFITYRRKNDSSDMPMAV